MPNLRTWVWQLWVFGSLIFYSAESGVNVPVVSECHKVVQMDSAAGQLKSHEQYPAAPYPPGFQCRYVIHAADNRIVEAKIGAGDVGLRPWDFAIIINGRVASKLTFICNVNEYKKLGDSGHDYIAVVQKNFINGLTRSIKSNTSTIIVDFCVHTFDKELDNRKGFLIDYAAVPAAEGAPETTGPDAPGGDALEPHQSNVVQPEPAVCGRPQNPPSNNPNHRIVNGVLARENSWPWICSLVQKPSLQFCGCTLIAEQWVVTAGHCVDNSGEEHLRKNVLVYLGVENLRMATDDHKFGIVYVVKHELYNDPPGSTANDIALIKLDRKVRVSSDVMPACLPARSVHEPPFVQTGAQGRRVCWVAGWGRLYDGQAAIDGGKIGAGSDNLRQVAIEVMSDGDCRSYMQSYIITNKMFCGGYDEGRYDSCQGDSGGPLVCDDGTGRWALYGVVSWGLGCAQARAPGIYTNVALMLDWLDAKMKGRP
ncbi:brain-specific serine protease 4-like [Paramacrobiotus metropolitanus]|uniref:brain-specific serine protease 4-like n=1 Tax=Paramacrobiotus metropolitanus TaxID=2943436 RepID=UPI0024456BE3|nr:brain-specific serine protease 4-like [Paramacrobiotus metropolitanus]